MTSQIYYLEDEPMWATYYLLLQLYHASENSTFLAAIYQDRAIEKLSQIGELSWRK